jgi:hypothetical protein
VSARTLPRRADHLADIEELAAAAVEVLGSGRGARLDPDALTSLAGAALALGADSVAVYRARSKASTSDTELISDTEEVAADVAARLQGALDLAEETRRELARARAAEQVARALLAAARALPIKEKCDGCHGEREDAIAEAQAAIGEALADQGCCEDALETLTELIPGLRRALALLRKVADDLETAYEPVYDHVRSGHVLPADGDWLTGHDGTTPAIPQGRPDGGPRITARAAFSDPR